jgi:hypothetical protein
MAFGGGTPDASCGAGAGAGTVDGDSASSEDDAPGLIAGLDLDGYHGSRDDFRAQLKSRLESSGEANVPHPSLGQGVPLGAPVGAGAASSTMAYHPAGSPPSAGVTLVPMSPPPASTVRHSLSATAVPSLAETWDSSAAVVDRGMGSRKLSFAAVESHAAMDVSDPTFELNQGASATNWEQLDPEVVGKSSKLLEFSDCGTGDFREPSFKVRYDADGSTVAPLEYSKHRMFKGKPSMPAYMPGLYTDSPTEATTLVVEMVDRVTNLKLNLYFTVYHNYDVITRRSVAVNDGDKPVCLTHLVSATVDFDAESRFFMTQLSGGWARERQVVTRKLDDGLTVVKSSRGASSHQFNPFLVISPDREPDEKHGECFAFCLVYGFHGACRNPAAKPPVGGRSRQEDMAALWRHPCICKPSHEAQSLRHSPATGAAGGTRAVPMPRPHCLTTARAASPTAPGTSARRRLGCTHPSLLHDRRHGLRYGTHSSE